MRRAIAEVVALTGADWRSLVAMPVDMFEELATAMRRRGDGINP